MDLDLDLWGIQKWREVELQEGEVREVGTRLERRKVRERWRSLRAMREKRRRRRRGRRVRMTWRRRGTGVGPFGFGIGGGRVGILGEPGFG